MKTRLSILALGIGFLAAAGVFSSVFSELRPNLVAGVAESKKEKCPEAPPREFSHTPYYTGPLIDAHLHLPSSSSIVSSVSTKMGKPTPAWDKTLSYEYVNCLLQSEGTKSAFGFHLLTKYSLSGEVNAAKALEKKHAGRITHFLMPTFINSAINPKFESVQSIVEKNLTLFRGIGELKFFDGRSPDDPLLQKYYALAEKYGLIVMMHPFDRHKEAVRKIVTEYSKATFLLHGIDSDGRGEDGGDNLAWVVELLRRNPNVYYSVDETLQIYGWKREHAGGAKLTKADSLPVMRERFDIELRRQLDRWKEPIESMPDRFLSGTDRWYGWHYDREASSLIIEFKRAFIGKLSPSVQEKYAYKNAEKLLER